MSGGNRRNEAIEDGAANDNKAGGTALVPVMPTVAWSRVPQRPVSRADFIAQLIATAEHIPQTRSLRRASPADANAAYGARWHTAPAPAAGIRTRQIV